MPTETKCKSAEHIEMAIQFANESKYIPPETKCKSGEHIEIAIQFANCQNRCLQKRNVKVPNMLKLQYNLQIVKIYASRDEM